MKNADHPVNVIKIQKILPHDNADSLEIIKVDDFTCVVRKGEFKIGQLAAYIEPDSLVPTDRKYFSFLAQKDKPVMKRITVIRLRGIWSMGLLMPIPEEIKCSEGSDIQEELGVEHYNPPDPQQSQGKDGKPVSTKGGQQAKQPPDHKKFKYPEYHIANFYRNRHVIPENTEVVITEKLHGANAFYSACATSKFGKFVPTALANALPKVFTTVTQFASSHYQFKKDPRKSKINLFIDFLKRKTGARPSPDLRNLYWDMVFKYPQLEKFCKENTNLIIYGEVLNTQKGFHYANQDGENSFRAFDIYVKDQQRWMDWDELTEACGYYNIPIVPVLYRGPFNVEDAKVLAEGKSTIDPATLREGVIVSTAKHLPEERSRSKFKIVGNGYLSQK